MYEINVICITAKHGGPVRSGPLSVHNKSVSTLEDLQIKQTRLPKKKGKSFEAGKTAAFSVQNDLCRVHSCLAGDLGRQFQGS